LEELDAFPLEVFPLVAGADEAVVLTGADETVLALLVGTETVLLVDLVVGMYLDTDFLVLDALELVAGADEAEVVFTGAEETDELALDEVGLADEAELTFAVVFGMYLDTDFLVLDTFVVGFTGADETKVAFDDEAVLTLTVDEAELALLVVLGMYLDTDFLVLDAFELVAGADEADVVFTGAEDTDELALEVAAELVFLLLDTAEVDLLLVTYLLADLLDTGLLAAELVVAADEVVAGLLADDEAAELTLLVGLLTDEVVFLVGGWGWGP